MKRGTSRTHLRELIVQSHFERHDDQKECGAQIKPCGWSSMFVRQLKVGSAQQHLSARSFFPTSSDGVVLRRNGFCRCTICPWFRKTHLAEPSVLHTPRRSICGLQLWSRTQRLERSSLGTRNTKMLIVVTKKITRNVFVT